MTLHSLGFGPPPLGVKQLVMPTVSRSVSIQAIGGYGHTVCTADVGVLASLKYIILSQWCGTCYPLHFDILVNSDIRLFQSNLSLTYEGFWMRISDDE